MEVLDVGMDKQNGWKERKDTQGVRRWGGGIVGRTEVRIGNQFEKESK